MPEQFLSKLGSCTETNLIWGPIRSILQFCDKCELLSNEKSGSTDETQIKVPQIRSKLTSNSTLIDSEYSYYTAMTAHLHVTIILI